MGKLPEEWELNWLDRLKVERSFEKDCTCKDAIFEIDQENHWVRCQTCGVRVDPYEALLKMARTRERSNEELAKHLKQAKELRNYKPKTKTIRSIEEEYIKNDYIPKCPHCVEPFKLEQLRFWTLREPAEKRIEILKQQRETEENGDKN